MKKFKKFKDYDDYGEMNEQRSDRFQRLTEKKMRMALRQRNVDRLVDIEDDYY